MPGPPPAGGQLRSDAIVFDLDGTLLDTMTAVPLAYVQAISELGGPDLTPQELVASWHLGPTPVLLAHYLQRPVIGSQQLLATLPIATARRTLLTSEPDLRYPRSKKTGAPPMPPGSPATALATRLAARPPGLLTLSRTA